MDKFKFFSQYKHYGQFDLLKEDALDDALGLGATGTDDANADPSNTPDPNNGGDTNNMPMDQASGGDTGMDAQPTDDTTEVDITSLVNKQNEINTVATNINTTISTIIKKITELDNETKNKLQIMDLKLSKNAEDIMRELQIRNPTPNEKMQLVSMSAAPYNVRLTDFWKATTEDKYRYAENNAKDDTFSVSAKVPEKNEEEKKEYSLKQSDIKADLNDADLKKSFNYV